MIGLVRVMLLALLLPGGALLAGFAPSPHSVQAHRDLQSDDARLQTIGWRLVSANAAYCRTRQSGTGLSLHALSQYGDRAAAIAAFGPGDQPAIQSVVDGSPADKAGLRANDRLYALNDAPFAPVSGNGDKPLDLVLNALETALHDGTVDVLAGPHAPGRKHQLRSQIVCASRFRVLTGGQTNADADGVHVSITAKLMAFAANDDELAAAVAHELAHNLLDHQTRLDAAGRSTGPFGQFGKSARVIRASEIEADALSLWLLANAGYDLDRALTFWDRFGREKGGGLLAAPTHPGWKKRLAMLRAERDAILATPPDAQGRRAPPLLVEPFKPLG